MINAKLLQLVIEASNDGIVVAEQEGDDNILIYANPAFQRLTGYEVDDILYQDCRFLQAGDRSAFWNELSITPVFNEGDQLTYYIGIQKDVTPEVEAKQRVRELEAEVQQLREQLAALQG